MSICNNDNITIPKSSSGVEIQAECTLKQSTMSTPIRWLLHDSPFIVMLLLAFVGLAFRLPVTYWVTLTPIFATISIVTGWSHFKTRQARMALVYSLALNWCALMLAIYLLYNSGVQGVLNANANTLSMMILLALGTFVAGVQARAWQICAVGAVLFLAVPGLGWLDQSPLLLAAATLLIIVLGGLAWWFSQGQQDVIEPSNVPSSP